MGKKRSLVSEKNEVELKTNNKKTKIEQTNEVPHNTKQYNVVVEVQQKICYKANKAFFEEFKDAQAILLGSKFVLEYASAEVAKKKTQEFNQKPIGNIKAKARFESKPNKPTLQDNQFGLIVFNAPASSTVATIKEHFPKACHVHKKKNKTGKFYILRYSQKEDSDADLLRSDKVSIDGTTVSIKTYAPRTSPDGPAKMNGKAPATPTTAPPTPTEGKKKRKRSKGNASPAKQENGTEDD